jgi:hypothetical protein
MSKLKYVLTAQWLTAKFGGVFALGLLVLNSASDLLGYAVAGRWPMCALAACGVVGFSLMARDLARATVIERGDV